MWIFAFLASTALAAPASVVEPPLEVIDAHLHTRFDGWPDKDTEKDYSQEQLEKEMKAAGVVGGVALTYEYDDGYHDLSRIGVFHCIGVREKIELEKIEEGLNSERFRCVKIYLGYSHRFAYDPAYKPVYKLAEKYGVPVVFHTGDTYYRTAKVKYADPLTIDEVAVDHPGVKFVIAHCGNPWIESAAEVAAKNANVYLDGSAFLLGNLDKLDRADVDEYMVRPLKWVFNYVGDPTKLMYGSDWPHVDMRSNIKAFKRAIPKKHWKAVFHDNAVRLFKLPQK